MSDNDGKNGRLRGDYQAYTLDTDQVQVLFERRYGYPPAEVVTAGPILLAGPIGGNGRRGGLLALVKAAQVVMTPERARQLALALEVTW